MIGFVETFDTPGIVRLDDIERIDDAKVNSSGVLMHKVHLRSGGTFSTFETENGGLLRRPARIIPSEPGTSTRSPGSSLAASVAVPASH